MSSTTNLDSLLTLMDDIAGEDFLDFADLPLDEAEAKKLVGLTLLKSQQELHQLDLTPDQRELTLLATAGHLVLENLLLHIRLLKAGGEPQEAVNDLLNKLK